MSEKKPISAAEASKPVKVVKEEKPVKKESGKKYFKLTKYAGMRFQVEGAVNDDPTTIKYEQATVVNKQVAGYHVATGYLATSNKKVIEYCEKRGFIQEIQEAEYNKALKR